MKTVILAGGLGTRLAEETEILPKPMVEIGGRPILWHILKHYAHYGFKEHYVALGYKGEVIKRYFRDYHELSGDLTVDLKTGEIRRHVTDLEDWVVHLVDTGQATSTGGRIRRLRDRLKDERFLVTYGDGVSDIDLQKLVDFHRSCGRLATLTAVRPPARFGGIVFEGDLAARFTEKPQIGEGWINGGYLVLEPGVFEYLPSDSTSLEIDALERLAADGQLAAFRHDGFWQCMDTLRDVRSLRGMWDSGSPPWRMWA